MVYLGQINGSYHFKDSEEKLIRFGKIRVDLIGEFSLHTDVHKGTLFSVRYFLSDQGSVEVPILSDLSIIAQ